MFEVEKLGFATPSSLDVLIGSRRKFLSAVTDSETCIDRVWWCPGHLSVSTNNGHDITTYDMVPEDMWRSNQSDDYCLDVKDSSKKLLCLWEFQPQSVVLLYEDGELTRFHFDTNSYSWNVVGSVIVTASRGATVQEACLHHDAIYWTEGSETPNEFLLCFRTLPRDGDDWNILGFGKQSIILKKCPLLELYSTSSGLVIWPRWISGPAICLSWNSAENSLNVVTPGVGVACTESARGVAVDFTSLVLKTMSSWHKVAPICDWKAVKHSAGDKQCFISQDGRMKRVSNKVEDIVTLEKFETDLIDAMNFRRHLVAVYSNCVRIWHRATGKLVQVIPASEPLNGCWIGGSTVPIAGLYGAKGIYQLKMNKQKEQMTSETPQGTSQWRASHAFDTLFEISQNKRNFQEPTNSTDREDPDLSELSTLLIGLLKECQSAQNSSKHQEEALEKLLEVHKKLETPLQQDLEPLICRFKELIAPDEGTVDIKSETAPNVNVLISTLLNSECILPTSFVCSCLETVVRCHPLEVIQGIDSHVGGNSIDDLSNEEKKSWDFLLNLSKPPWEIFKTICRLKYLKTPNKVKTFVDTALRIKEKYFELFIYDNPSYIYGQIAKSLPLPDQSVEYEEAAVVLVWILVKSDILFLSSGDHESLQTTLSLLGTERDWGMVITMATEISHDVSMRPHYLNLYYPLLNAMEKAQVLPSFRNEILKLAPKNLGTSAILDVVGKFPEKCPDRLFASDGELTIKHLQELLEHCS